MHRLFAATVGVMALWSVVMAQPSTVSGTLTYRERIALPASATVDVTIEDVSRADVAAPIVARLRMPPAGQVPIPFDLEYDTNRIDPSHRYAVRASISDGDRLLFTSTEATLVITQGHPSRVALVLRAAPATAVARPPAAPGPAARPLPPIAPLPPPAELRNLPATFAGTIPCADCPGIRYQLNLMPDDTFMLRMTYMGKPPSTTHDEIGSWALASDRRALALRGDRGPAETFEIRDAGTLRKLDVSGQPIASPRPYELHRGARFEPLAFKGRVRGAYRATGGSRTFTPCSTGHAWAVAIGRADTRLPAANSPARGVLLLDVTGHLQSAGSNTFVIDETGPAAPGGTCEPRFASAPLDGPTWMLSWIDGHTFQTPSSPRNHPSLTFRGDTPTFAGTGGCNRLAGRYDARGDEMRLSAAGTLRACPGSDATEASFTAALAATRTYRVVGRSLELFDARRQLLARFEADRD